MCKNKNCVGSAYWLNIYLSNYNSIVEKMQGLDLLGYVPYNKNAFILSFTEAEKMSRNILKRLLVYIAGLFVMTIGIALGGRRGHTGCI